jgi:hypothetical protein
MNLLENATNAVEILLYSGSNCDFGIAILNHILISNLLRNLTSDVSWPGQVFISGNHHLISRFCKDE